MFITDAELVFTSIYAHLLYFGSGELKMNTCYRSETFKKREGQQDRSDSNN